MKLGIIGRTGAGKTTIFEALTRLPPETEMPKGDYRLGTIRMPDQRVDVLSDMYQPKKTIYTQVEYVLPVLKSFKQEPKQDDAVWVPVRNCDALLHVVRNFPEYDLESPAPARDFRALDQEMIFADLLIVEKRLERLETDKKRGKKISQEEVDILGQCKQLLEGEIPLRRHAELAAAPLLRGYTFVSAKPMLIIFNNADEDEALPPVGKILEEERCLAVRGKLEHELAQMSDDDAGEYRREFGIKTSAMDRVIEESYALLGLISFFTVGKDEVRAWTIKKKTAAVDAAEVIHSDIKKGFIRAEVLAYQDLLAAGSYKEARSKGTARLEGKTYEVQDGDIIEFRFNV